jgi:glycosyltransferase involved in cell wall biosynthesis
VYDISHKIWLRKQEHWRYLEFTLVAPSQWMARIASKSQLLPKAKIEIIPHGVDTQTYRPRSKQQARTTMNLPSDKQLILFGSASERLHKGFDLLRQAIDRLQSEEKRKVNLILFGPEKAGLDSLGIDICKMGNIVDEEKLATLYAAADITVVPSRQESFGLIALESLACGTPVVAFATSGLLEIIDHAKNGYLARPFDAEDLAHGMSWMLSNHARLVQIGENARKKAVSEFDIAWQSARYQTLYEELRQ